jgi:hypothetical protein
MEGRRCVYAIDSVGAHRALCAKLKAARGKVLTAKRLRKAWGCYLELFGDVPHGTAAQLGALLELAGIRQSDPAGKKGAKT